jgi:hypothetical protein
MTSVIHYRVWKEKTPHLECVLPEAFLSCRVELELKGGKNIHHDHKNECQPISVLADPTKAPP